MRRFGVVGPAGRRAALAGGPDVWEVIETLKGTELAGEDAIAAAAQWGNLPAAHRLRSRSSFVFAVTMSSR